MTEEANTIGAAELRVSIQAGPEYEATPRLKAALDELAAALEEADELDTTGFSTSPLLGGFSLFYTSPTDLTYTESDSRGTKKGNVEYGWKVEEGVKG